VSLSQCRALSISLLVFLTGLSACSSEPHQHELYLSAAISLKDVVKEMKASFENKHPGSELVCNFASSGQLAQQIAEGAPVDVFMSASNESMQKLEHDGFLRKNDIRKCAANEIVVVAPNSKNFKNFEELKTARLIAIGNPKTVPVGAYAEQGLRSHGIFSELSEQKRIVFAENDRQVLSFVESGNVDAGVVYQTDLRSSDKVHAVLKFGKEDVPEVQYLISITKKCKREALAKVFEDFVLSETGQKIFQSRGFRK